ncbi:ComEC/Rec2 family competence protein [Lacticaseibacillus sp. GG6-2]
MNGRWWLISAGVIGGIVSVVGPQVIGLAVVVYVVLKARKQALGWVIGSIVAGLLLGWHEVKAHARPLPPTGIITVMSADWQIGDHFVRYAGRAANGVWTSGSAAIDDATMARLQTLEEPAEVRVSKPPERLVGARNLYEFDFAGYAWAQSQQAYQFDTQPLVWQPRAIHGLWEWLASLRVKLLHRLESLPPHVSRYAKGLLLGVVDEDFDALRGALVDLGIFHLFSVSGLHLFALIGVLYWVADRLRVPKEAIDWGLIGMLPALLVIIPPGAGILRAVWMRVLASLNARLGLTLTGFDCFCLVLLGNVIWRPLVLYTFGGQLTYLLTGVLMLMPALAPRVLAWRLFIIGAPVVIAHTFKLHLLGGWFNWLLMPIFEVAIMPMLVLVAIWPTTPLPSALEGMLTGLEGGLAALDRLPGMLIFGALTPIVAALGVATALIGVERRRWRYLVVWVLGAYALANWHPQSRVVVFDVGQGDAILIEAANKNGTMLIDTGGRLFGKVRNPLAVRVIINYLHARGVAKLDTLVLTHADADHVGDAAVFTHQMPVTNVVTTPLASHQPLVQAALAGKVATHQEALAGQTVAAGRLQLRVVAPNSTTATEKNADSLVLYGKIGDGNWLFTGDADAHVETTELLPQQLDVDYLKVAHHGSKTASTPAFIASITPAAAFISAGAANRYGHPHQETLATLDAAGVPWWNTAASGMIWVDMTATSHHIQTMLKE